MFSGIDLSPTHDLAGRWTCGIVLEDFGVHQVAVVEGEERWNCWALVVVVVEWCHQLLVEEEVEWSCWALVVVVVEFLLGMVVVVAVLVEVVVVDLEDAEVPIFDRFATCNSRWICQPPSPSRARCRCRPPLRQ